MLLFVQHCNCILKSAIGILDLNNYWLEGMKAPIVKNEDSIRKIAGDFDDTLPHQNTGTTVNTVGLRIQD